MAAPSANALRSQLKESVTDAVKAYNALESIISFQVRIPGQTTGKIVCSQPPWNSTVAFSVLELHQLAREQEARLRIYASQPVRPRGGSDENTKLALEAVCSLAEAAPDKAVQSADREIDTWVRKAKIILGELELPQRLPRLPGKSEPVCPFCKRRSLRMFPLRGVVVCILPCKDSEDRKPFARMEFSKFTQNFELVWQDNVVGVPA